MITDKSAMPGMLGLSVVHARDSEVVLKDRESNCHIWMTPASTSTSRKKDTILAYMHPYKPLVACTIKFECLQLKVIVVHVLTNLYINSFTIILHEDDYNS